jgi:hypothetical protein
MERHHLAARSQAFGWWLLSDEWSAEARHLSADYSSTNREPQHTDYGGYSAPPGAAGRM